MEEKIKSSIPLECIEIGMTESYSKTITDADIKVFAGLSGDYNPVHMSDEYAKSSRFGRRIAHGFISVSFFSALFGTKLPGHGCVYASQNVKFKRPVYLGDLVTATIKVVGVDMLKRLVFFETTCKVKNKEVISGTAELYIPKNKNKK